MSDAPERGRVAGVVAHRAAEEVRAVLRPYTIPNGITLLRLAVTPFFVLSVVEGNYELALAIFVLAGVSDVLDGLIARALAMRSPFGAYLDPIADKVLVVSAYLALTLRRPDVVTIPTWLTVLALSRDALIVLVALALYLGAGIRNFDPSVWGKATTFLHILTIGLVLVANLTAVPPAWLAATFYVTLFFTIVSGLDYVRLAARTAERLHDGPKP